MQNSIDVTMYPVVFSITKMQVSQKKITKMQDMGPIAKPSLGDNTELSPLRLPSTKTGNRHPKHY
jgi:hypothetical protein